MGVRIPVEDSAPAARFEDAVRFVFDALGDVPEFRSTRGRQIGLHGTLALAVLDRFLRRHWMPEPLRTRHALERGRADPADGIRGVRDVRAAAGGQAPHAVRPALTGVGDLALACCGRHRRAGGTRRR